MHLIKKLWSHFSRMRRRQFKFLLILMVLSSLLEVVSIGAVFPFLAVLTNPDIVFNHPIVEPLINKLGLTQSDQIILPFTIVFIAAVLFSAIVRLLLLYVVTRLSYAAGADISIEIYRRTLYQDYQVHLSRNSSEIINGIINKTNTVIGGVLNPSLTLLSSIILLAGILSTLFLIDTRVALVVFMGFGSLYGVVIFYTRKRLKKNSNSIAGHSTLMIKSLQEGLGGIRDVIIDGSQEFYCKLYRKSDIPFRYASGNNQFIAGSPRFIMEGVGISIISIVAFFIMREGSIFIPVLGVFALGAQRILPLLQQVFSTYTTIKGARSSFEDVLKLLEQPISNHLTQKNIDPIKFDEAIKLKNLSFKYSDDSPWVLKNINLTIKKGECIGFVGLTGSGKSTLIDIIMGLLTPTKGELIIDNNKIIDKNKVSWQKKISHVPQNIFLSDGTIEGNIAFAIDEKEVNKELIDKAANQAQIYELIQSWEQNFNTIVGERGARLSGGQKQRIGIARALYKNTEVIIFDEATSALDSKTEKDIMREIEGLNKNHTILIIAHRVSTLKTCNRIIEVGKDGIITILDKDNYLKSH
jgi:ATP-binding cassette, subfamily B, bacterial PglK